MGRKAKTRNYFGLYETTFEKMRGNSTAWRELCGDIGKKDVTYDDYLKYVGRGLFAEIETERQFTHASFIIDEYIWVKRNNRRVIFMDSPSLIDTLFNSELQITEGATVEVPFDSFCLSFPKGTTLAGQKLPPCLVTIMKPEQMQESVAQDFKESYDIDVPDMTYIPRSKNVAAIDDYMICIKFYDKEIDSVSQVAVNLSQAIWDCTTDSNSTLSQEHAESLKKTGKGSLGFILLKLVILSLIYNTATKGQALKEGWPELPIKLPSSTNKTHYRAIVLHDVGASSDSKRAITARVAHFRNLKSDRYYQGEYAHMPKGSRWVFVSEYKRDVDAHHISDTV